MAKQSYQNIRQQLVELSLELEDRDKVMLALQNQIENERFGLSEVESVIAREYFPVLEAAEGDFEERIAVLVSDCDAALTHRKELIASCKALLATHEAQESCTVDSLRKLRRESADRLEAERVRYASASFLASLIDGIRYKAGQPERQSKLLAEKYKEIRSTTLKGLQPEVDRIVQKYESDVRDREHRVAVEEDRLRDAMEAKTEARVKEERQRIMEAHARTRMSAANTLHPKAQRLEADHQGKLKHMARQAATELRELRAHMAELTEQDRREHSQELSSANASIQRRLRDLRETHAAEMRALRSAHEQDMQEIRACAEREKEEWEQRFKQSAREELAAQTTDIQRRTQTARDRRIQQAIRDIQEKQMAYETHLQAQTQEEIKRVEKNTQAEKEMLELRQKEWGRRMSEMTAVHEAERKLQQEVKAKLDAVEMQLHHTRAHLEEAEQRKREAEMEANEERSSAGEEQISELASAYHELECETRQCAERCERELEQLHIKHEEELGRLDKEIKAEVVRREIDTADVRDAVHTQKVRYERLKKMLARYTETV